MKHGYLGQQAWPTGVSMPAVPQQIAEWSMELLVAIALLWGLRNIVVRREPALVICMMAGGISCVLEPHTMVMLRFFYPQVGQNIFLVGFGQPIPVFIPFMYSVVFGYSSYLFVIARQSRSFSATGFLLGMAMLFLAEAVLEVVSIHTGIWAYFDDQPFLVLDFPIHVAVIVGCMCVILGAASRIWFDRVKGLRQWWMLLLGPTLLIATFDAFTYPFAFAVSSDGGLPTARIGSLISMLLSLGITFHIAKALARVPDVSVSPVVRAKSAAASVTRATAN